MSTFNSLREALHQHYAHSAKRPEIVVLTRRQITDLLTEPKAVDRLRYTPNVMRLEAVALVLGVEKVIEDNGDLVDLRGVL